MFWLKRKSETNMRMSFKSQTTSMWLISGQCILENTLTRYWRLFRVFDWRDLAGCWTARKPAKLFPISLPKKQTVRYVELVPENNGTIQTWIWVLEMNSYALASINITTIPSLLIMYCLFNTRVVESAVMYTSNASLVVCLLSCPEVKLQATTIRWRLAVRLITLRRYPSRIESYLNIYISPCCSYIICADD